MTENDHELAQSFHEQMLHIYERAKKECNYKPTRFLTLVNSEGGVAAAKQLLRRGGYSEGLTRLWEEGRLDISMEALVVAVHWRPLFTDEEIAQARKSLADLGYP